MSKSLGRQPRSSVSPTMAPPTPPRFRKESSGTPPSTPASSAPPTPHSGQHTVKQKKNPSRSSSPAQRLHCALRALQCSSRADGNEEQQRRLSRTTNENHRDSFPVGAEGSYDKSGSFPEPYRVMESQKSPSSVEHDKRSRNSGRFGDLESDGTGSVLLGLCQIEDDHPPFERSEGDDDHEAIVPTESSSHPLTPSSSRRRISIDPPGTPGVSNRTTGDKVVKEPRSSIPDAAFDELCQQNFNTSPKRWKQKGSLGDAITPQLSPEQPSSDESGTSPTSAKRSATLTPEAYAELQIPIMPSNPQDLTTLRHRPDGNVRNSITSHASTVTQLYGELLSASETKTDISDDQPIPHYSDAVLLNDNRRFMTAASRNDESRTFTSPLKEKTPPKEGSTFSSVSSFEDIPMKEEGRIQNHSELLSRPPFFWRSHPRVTVYSYTSHQPQTNHIQEMPDNLHDSFQSNYTSFPNSRRSSVGLDSDTLPSVMRHGRNLDNSFSSSSSNNNNNNNSKPTAVFHTLISYAGTKLPKLFTTSHRQ